MRILITGKGTSGSWQIRGVQLGAAIGADVVPNAQDVRGYDAVVIVKRPTPELLQHLHRAGVPIVWDVVDAWPQPLGNGWDRQRCLEWLASQVRAIRPAGIVAATRAMAQDCEVFGVPILALPHHARPGLRMNPIRPIKRVAYEGGEQYIIRWRSAIQAQCARRGWEFVTQPAELADVDVVLALRDAGGYAPRQWKSNVKLANAQGSGTPVICCREAGYLETQSGAERWADTPHELGDAFDSLESAADRIQASRKLKSAELTIDGVAAKYMQWLRSNF